MANKPLKTIKFPGLSDTYTVPQIDNTLEVTGAAADAKKVGDEISDLKDDLNELDEKIDAKEGISDDVKEALLACFENVAWIGQDGQTYYDALYTALYAQSPVTRIIAVNNEAYGKNLALDGNYYAKINDGLTARCRFDPIRNKGSIVNVVDATKYSVAIYDLQNNELVDYEVKPEQTIITQQGYLMSTDVAPSYVKSVEATGNYFACAFKKESGVDFTTDEIENAEGTIFVIGNLSDIVKWNGTDTGGITQKWIDKDQIIGITNPKEYALVSGYGVTGYHESNGGKVQISAKRATSLSQVIIGDFDGKTIGLSNYTLSTGAQIAYGIWYGYINPNNNSYNGTNYISDGTDNVYVFGKWNTENIILPVDSLKIGKRVILLAFKITNADREFTQAELKEIPTLIQIS